MSGFDAQRKWKQVGPLGITACTEHAEIIAKAQPVDQTKKPRHQPAHAAVLPLFPTKDIEPAAQEYGQGDAPFDPALPLFHKGGWRPGEGQGVSDGEGRDRPQYGFPVSEIHKGHQDQKKEYMVQASGVEDVLKTKSGIQPNGICIHG